MIPVQMKVFCRKVNKIPHEDAFLVFLQQAPEVAEPDAGEALALAEIHLRVLDGDRYVLGRTYDLKIG